MSTPTKGIICKCPPLVLFKKNQSFGGDMNNSSITNALRYSEIVRGQGGQGNTSFISNTLNAFGYYSGGPGGSGAPPRNTF